MCCKGTLLKGLLVVVLAVVFSAFTLWLLESWIKYPLFVFEILIIIILYLLVYNDFDIKVKTIRIESLNVGLIVSLFLIASSLILLMFNLLRINGGFTQSILALLSTSFLSGYALLNLLGLTPYFSKLENLVLSYIFSYIFTGFSTLIFLLISKDSSTLFILSSFIILGIVSAFQHPQNKKQTFPSVPKSFSKNIDFLTLIVIIAFYVISFYFIYPSFALLPGTDISRHYARSIVLIRAPNLYIGSSYLLFHLHESAFMLLSNSSLVTVQTALLSLNLMLPLAFYIMVKSYLEKIDMRLPSLATIFWTIFTNSFGGFAWLYFVRLKLSTTKWTQFQLLTTTAHKTYNGTIYGIFGLWYVPAVVAMIFLMVTTLLMNKKKIPTTKYFVLFSTVLAAFYFTYIPIAVVFILFLAIYGIISRNQSLRIDDTIKSSVIGLVFVFIIYHTLPLFMTRFIISMSILISLLSTILALFFSLLIRKKIRPNFQRLNAKLRLNNFFFKKISLLLLFIYLVAFLTWVSLVDSFTFQVNTIGLVPWFMYPLILGVNGLLAIFALYFLQDIKYRRVLIFFVAFLVFTFILGKSVSLVNLYLFNAGYWEKRFLWFIKIPIAILAPIPILFLIRRIMKKNTYISLKIFVSVIVIGIIVLSGISTTFLNLEYWKTVTSDSNRFPSSEEWNAIEYLNEMFDKNPKTWLVTITKTSKDITTFAAPSDAPGLRQILYTAYTPEMAFSWFYRHPAYCHPYIYLHNRDKAYLNKFNDRFFTEYLRILPLIFKNSEVKIYNVSKLSFPQPKSDSVLVIPLDKITSDQDLYVAYHVLSQGFYNYTVAYDVDNNIFDAKTIILSFDPPKKNILTCFFKDNFNQTSSYWKTIRGKWQIKNYKLLGGEAHKYGVGIILSPVFTENFTSTFKVRPVSGNIAVLNYVGLIYSWRDDKHYRIAEIFFNKDGYIYACFRIIENTSWGYGTTIPKWPGINTGIKWRFGDYYNIKVRVQKDLNELYINNKRILSIHINNIKGWVGLFYGRFNSVSFDDFKINGSRQINIRPHQDYINNYVKKGGKLIVLNTNGYYSFADSLFYVKKETATCSLIKGIKSKINLPVGLDVQFLLPKNNSHVLSYYITRNSKIPYILKSNVGDGEIYYINLYPYVNALKVFNNTPPLYFTLGNLISEINLPKFNFNLKIQCDGYAEKIFLKNVHIKSESLLFPLKINIENVTVLTSERKFIFENVTSISIKNELPIYLETESAIIENGRGLYTSIDPLSLFQITSPDSAMVLRLKANENEIVLSNVYKLIVNDKIILLAKTPYIKAMEATFYNLFSFRNLYWKTKAYGHNLKVSDVLSFYIPISDAFTLLEDVKIVEGGSLDPPLVTYDIVQTINSAIFWVFVLLPIHLLLYILFLIKKKKMTKTKYFKKNL